MLVECFVLSDLFGELFDIEFSLFELFLQRSGECLLCLKLLEHLLLSGYSIFFGVEEFSFLEFEFLAEVFFVKLFLFSGLEQIL